ncbi:hypothetical protein [Sorangium sp. So ce1024]|uniref:hypothetical protein n=1 Tax=Sorangium sp. So ce1024 TaxID=3133327 RepID=UPI003EFBF655
MIGLKLNGAALQSYRTTAVGVLQFVLTASIAIASTSTDQPALLFWAVLISAGANLLIGLLSADHARIAKSIADGIAAWEELQRQRQAKGALVSPPGSALGSPVVIQAPPAADAEVIARAVHAALQAARAARAPEPPPEVQPAAEEPRAAAPSPREGT